MHYRSNIRKLPKGVRGVIFSYQDLNHLINVTSRISKVDRINIASSRILD